jgi:hypothetical protein
MQQTLIIAELLLRYTPALARSVATIFYKSSPTLEDWEKVFALAEKTNDRFDAEARARADKAKALPVQP